MYPFSIEKSKNNRDILKINGRYIHSQFAPEKEALHLTYPGRNLIAVFGLGLAYHVNNLLTANPDSFIIVYEPHPDIRARYESYLNREASANLLLLDGPEDPRIHNFIEKSQVIYQGRIYTYSNVGYKSLYPHEENRFFSRVKAGFDLVVQNFMTEANFLPLWTKNILYNLTNTEHNPLVEITSQNRGENLAVIVCSGPSATTDFPFLKQHREKLTIIAVDTSLKPLVTYGITPDFVVSLDGQYYSLDDFIPRDLDECAFIFDILSYPRVQHLYRHVYYTFTGNLYSGSILKYCAEALGLKASCIETGGTVSDFALNLACLMGFTKIYLTGLDLGFPSLLTHCKHSPYYDRLLWSGDYFNPPLARIASIISARGVFKAPGKEESSWIFTDFILKNYASYFERFAAARQDIQLFYTNQAGLRLSGFFPVSLQELAHPATCRSKRLSHQDLTFLWHKTFLEPGKMKPFASQLAAGLYSLSQELTEVLNNTDFTSSSPELQEQCAHLYDRITANFPFLTNFALMPRMILSKKNIYANSLIWYKHIFFKLLQSIYFIIRILQKI